VRRASLALVLAAVALVPARSVRAEDAQTQAFVQALFADARTLLKAHRYDEACPKLEEVLRLEPQGNGARMLLAECFESQGRLASSWATYVAAEAFAHQRGQTDREARAHERAEALSSRLSRVRVVVAEAARAPGLEVKLDAVVLGAAQWGTLLPVDGGTHAVTASAPGRVTHRAEVSVEREGATVTLEVPTLSSVPAPVASASVAPPPSAAPPIVPPPAPLPQRTERPAHVPWTLGTGAALAITGVVFALDLRAVSQRQDDLCGGDLKQCARTTPDYDPSSDNARKTRDFGLALGFGGAGAALVAVGLYGLFSSPSAVTPVATLGPSGGFVGVRVLR
jgi:hypothetical protein